jgi:hypothetical protein
LARGQCGQIGHQEVGMLGACVTPFFRTIRLKARMVLPPKVVSMLW